MPNAPVKCLRNSIHLPVDLHVEQRIAQKLEQNYSIPAGVGICENKHTTI